MVRPERTMDECGAPKSAAPGRRISIAKIERLLRRRACVCFEAADRYAAMAVGEHVEFYRQFAATERCAGGEVLHLIEMICGPEARHVAACEAQKIPLHAEAA